MYSLIIYLWDYFFFFTKNESAIYYNKLDSDEMFGVEKI